MGDHGHVGCQWGWGHCGVRVGLRDVTGDGDKEACGDGNSGGSISALGDVDEVGDVNGAGAVDGVGGSNPQQGSGLPQGRWIHPGSRGQVLWRVVAVPPPAPSPLLFSWCSCRGCWSCQASTGQREQLAGRIWSGTGAWRRFAWPPHRPWPRPVPAWSAVSQHCCTAGPCVSGDAVGGGMGRAQGM